MSHYSYGLFVGLQKTYEMERFCIHILIQATLMH